MMNYKNNKHLSQIGIFFSLLILIGFAIFGMQSVFLPTIKPTKSQEPASSVRDGLLFNLPCTVPCWQGITPGITSKDEAIKNLRNFTFIPTETLHTGEQSESRGGADWKWHTDDDVWTVSWIEWCDGIVCEISLLPDSIITVDEIISRFGPPEKISVTQIGIPEDPEWGFSFYYPKNGLQVLVHISGAADALLVPSANIFGVYLFTHMTIEERIAFSGLSIEVEDLRDWMGYGNISDLYVK